MARGARQRREPSTGQPLTQVATVPGIGLSVPIANRSLATETSINLHAWAEYEISRDLGQRAREPLRLRLRSEHLDRERRREPLILARLVLHHADAQRRNQEAREPRRQSRRHPHPRHSSRGARRNPDGGAPGQQAAQRRRGDRHRPEAREVERRDARRGGGGGQGGHAPARERDPRLAPPEEPLPSPKSSRRSRPRSTRSRGRRTTVRPPASR